MKGRSVLLISSFCFVFVTVSCAMSKTEIEEFNDFIKRSSVLDQNLKGGFHKDHDEDETDISDHAWEESGKFEGDLILNDRQRRVIVEDVAEGLSRNGLTDVTKRWPNNEVIYYIQREHFSGEQVQAIIDGIQDLGRASCVKFRPYRKGDRDAVVVQGSRRGCFSQVGYQGGYQVLNLYARHPVGKGCFRHGTVVHEFLHTLGFYHMQSSPDRDDFIKVVWENIVEPAKHNFRKYNTFSVSDFGVGYDYDSVLHYSRKAFSANGGDTLVPKQGGARIGQRIGLSDKDTQKLSKMYCDAESDHAIRDDVVSKPVIKKKTRNQPFEGHGIGYHQGKTVVIKLPGSTSFKLPKTVKLSFYPKYHMFDYFSKAPQALSPTLDKSLKSGSDINLDLYSEPLKNNKNDYGENDKKNIKGNYFDEKESVQRQTAEDEYTPNYDEKQVRETFERLDKIITAHVYPSQKSLYGTLKASDDYRNLYYPSNLPEKSSQDDENKSNTYHVDPSPLSEASQGDTGIKQSFNKDYLDRSFSYTDPMRENRKKYILQNLYDPETEIKYGQDLDNKNNVKDSLQTADPHLETPHHTYKGTEVYRKDEAVMKNDTKLSKYLPYRFEKSRENYKNPLSINYENPVVFKFSRPYENISDNNKRSKISNLNILYNKPTEGTHQDNDSRHKNIDDEEVYLEEMDKRSTFPANSDDLPHYYIYSNPDHYKDATNNFDYKKFEKEFDDRLLDISKSSSTFDDFYESSPSKKHSYEKFSGKYPYVTEAEPKHRLSRY